MKQFFGTIHPYRNIWKKWVDIMLEIIETIILLAVFIITIAVSPIMVKKVQLWLMKIEERWLNGKMSKMSIGSDTS